MAKSRLEELAQRKTGIPLSIGTLNTGSAGQVSISPSSPKTAHLNGYVDYFKDGDRAQFAAEYAYRASTTIYVYRTPEGKVFRLTERGAKDRVYFDRGGRCLFMDSDTCSVKDRL